MDRFRRFEKCSAPVGGAYGRNGAGGSSAGHAEKVGIYIHNWATDLKHRVVESPGGVRRVRDCPRVGASLGAESREAIRSFMHAYLPDWEERQRDLQALPNA